MQLYSQELKPAITKCDWQGVREEVIKIAPNLAAIIDVINPDSRHTLFKVRYPYGSHILKHSRLFIPNNTGALVPIDDESIEPSIQESLRYNLDSNPVTLVLNKSVELFAELDDRTIPLYGPIRQGRLFGTYRVLSSGPSHQPAFIWDMTAGARSIFFAAKISDTEGHTRIRKAIQLKAEKPRSLMDHWHIFKEISNHQDFSEPWNTELLFFSKSWFEHLNDSAWKEFNYYLMKNVWNGGDFWNNHFVWNMIFSIIQENNKIKPCAYIADTVKHLLGVGVGASPGFAPAINDESAPISSLQKFYLEIYRLKNYAPIIMHPQMFDMYEQNNRAVYYSLQFPNAIEFGQKSRKRSSFVDELYHIRSLLNKYIHEIASNKFNIKNTPLYDLTSKVTFDYFHNNVELLSGMRSSEAIPDEDQNFEISTNNTINKTFPANSPFVRGCIRIAHK